MATNYIQPGRHLTMPAPADVNSGDLVKVGSIIGVALGAGETGVEIDLAVVGVFNLPKVSALAINIGDTVYLDEANSVVTTDDDAGANAAVGYAVTAAANPSPSVNVRLVPTV